MKLRIVFSKKEGVIRMYSVSELTGKYGMLIDYLPSHISDAATLAFNVDLKDLRGLRMQAKKDVDAKLKELAQALIILKKQLKGVTYE